MNFLNILSYLQNVLYYTVFFTFGFAIGTSTTIIFYTSGFETAVNIILRPYLILPIAFGVSTLFYIFIRRFA